MKKILTMLGLIVIVVLFWGCSENDYEANDAQVYDYNAEEVPVLQSDEIDGISDIGRALNVYFDIEAYELGEQQSLTAPHAQTNEIFTILWHNIDLLGEQISLTGLSRGDVANAFASEIGDILYVTMHDIRALFIDIGPAPDWSPYHRSYHIILLE